MKEEPDGPSKMPYPIMSLVSVTIDSDFGMLMRIQHFFSRGMGTGKYSMTLLVLTDISLILTFFSAGTGTTDGTNFFGIEATGTLIFEYVGIDSTWRASFLISTWKKSLGSRLPERTAIGFEFYSLSNVLTTRGWSSMLPGETGFL